MKLALAIASVAVCNLIAVTGCAVSSDDPDGRDGAKNERTSTSDRSSIDENDDKTREAEKNGDALDTPLTPTMACRIWEWVDGRRICRW